MRHHLSTTGTTTQLLLALLLCLFNFVPSSSYAVPLFSSETKLEATITTPSTDSTSETVCVVDDVVYAVGDSVSPPEQCQRCICAGAAGVACTSIQCPLRPGCRAVQRPDQCCPDYICECTVGERVYDNGARIPEAGSPCQVCYCRGGSVECAVLECFWRDDCEPRYEPGRCCPKFDHCPPPADAQHSSRPMNSSTPKMAELTSSTLGLPVVKFQQVFPSSSPLPARADEPSTQESTVTDEGVTVADVHAASTPTQDGGVVTESAVEAPSEPSSAPENLRLGVSDVTEEVTTESSTEVVTETSTKLDDTEAAAESKTEEVVAVTDNVPDFPAELRLDESETTTVQEDSVTEVPETTIDSLEVTETIAPEIRQDEVTENYAPASKEEDTASEENKEVITETYDVVDTTTFEIPTTTEINYETNESKQKSLSSDVAENIEVTTTTENVPIEERKSDDDSLVDIQTDKIAENLETSTEDQVTEENPGTETSTEQAVTESVQEIAEGRTENSVADETPVGTEPSSTESVQEAVEVEGRSEKSVTDEAAVVTEETAAAVTETTTEENAVDEITTAENVEAEARFDTEAETTTGAETTTDNIETTTQQNKFSETNENNSSLISLLGNELVPAIGIESESINTDLVKNISKNMVPATSNEDNRYRKENNDNKPSILEEIAKTIEKDNFPFNLPISNSSSTATTESSEYLSNASGFIDSEFGDSVEEGPFPRPLDAPATSFNDWRLAAVQDSSEEGGLQPWRDEVDLSVDSGAADILILPWSQQHLRRRRAEHVAEYVRRHP